MIVDLTETSDEEEEDEIDKQRSNHSVTHSATHSITSPRLKHARTVEPLVDLTQSTSSSPTKINYYFLPRKQHADIVSEDRVGGRKASAGSGCSSNGGNGKSGKKGSDGVRGHGVITPSVRSASSGVSGVSGAKPSIASPNICHGVTNNNINVTVPSNQKIKSKPGVILSPGVLNVPPSSTDVKWSISQRELEEKRSMQEAIKRSMEDQTPSNKRKYTDVSTSSSSSSTSRPATNAYRFIPPEWKCTPLSPPATSGLLRTPAPKPLKTSSPTKTTPSSASSKLKPAPKNPWKASIPVADSVAVAPAGANSNVAVVSRPVQPVKKLSNYIAWKRARPSVKLSGHSSNAPGAQYKLLEDTVLKSKQHISGGSVMLSPPSLFTSSSTGSGSLSHDVIGTNHTSALIKSINLGNSHRLVSQIKLMISAGLSFPSNFIPDLVSMAVKIAGEGLSPLEQMGADKRQKVKVEGTRGRKPKQVKKEVSEAMDFIDSVDDSELRQAMEAISNILGMLTVSKNSRETLWEWSSTSALICDCIVMAVTCLINFKDLCDCSAIMDSGDNPVRAKIRLNFILKLLNFFIANFDNSTFSGMRNEGSASEAILGQDLVHQLSELLTDVFHKEFVSLLIKDYGDGDGIGNISELWPIWCELLRLVGEVVNNVSQVAAANISYQSSDNTQALIVVLLGGMKVGSVKTPIANIVQTVFGTSYLTSSTTGSKIINIVMLSHAL